ncbi:MAG: bifunctional DNA-formamidopyrimidine glycosylase/DNA-(apurinic or apyrimidinic site) lyase [Acetobacteraceae bacterium]|nr:bifunctional DNA-formamidopyrimidine glycosylase/DNA-(apurinic or apyrimidinic site) lyase [Acetobacteraceae bacterium]
MPELPEVETVRRTLEPEVLGRTVLSVAALDPLVLGGEDPAAFSGRLVGRAFHRLERRGKYLLFDLGGLTMTVHLGMTGRLVAGPPQGPLRPHDRVVWALDGGREMRYHDVRRLGRVLLAGPAGEALGPGASGFPPGLRRLGPEPLAENAASVLARAFSGRRTPIKALLLEQRVLAGVGNIYADEALFLAGINPLRPAGGLSPGEVAALASALRQVLGRAIEAGGTTVSDYRDGRGRPGEYAVQLKVYGRGGQPCPACGGEIRRTRVRERSAHYCPTCQRLDTNKRS